MDRETALKIADGIRALINSSPRSPSSEQIADVILAHDRPLPFPPEIMISMYSGDQWTSAELLRLTKVDVINRTNRLIKKMLDK